MLIRIKNYQIIEDMEIEATGITIIGGQNGNGKSSLVRAIRAACYGQLGTQFIRHGAKECEVELDFGVDKFKWIHDETDIYFYLNGKRYDKTKGKAPEDYEKALGISKIGVTKTTDLRPNFSMQFDPLFLIYLGEVEMANALSFLFSGQKFPNLLKSISGSIKDTKKDLIYLEGQIDQKEKSIVEAKKGLEAYQIFEKWFSMKDKLFQWYQEISEIGTYVNNISVLGSDIDASTVRINSLKELSQRFSPLNEFLVLEIEDLNSELKILREEDDKIFSLTTARDSMLELLKDKKVKIEELAATLSNCPFCGVVLGDSEKAKIMEGSHEH